MDLMTKHYLMRNVLNKFDTSIVILLFFHLFKTAFSDNRLLEKLKDNESNDINSTFKFDDFIKNDTPTDTTADYIDDVQNRSLLDNCTKSRKEHKLVNFEFHRIKTPFLISVWIFCASLAKIGFHMYPKLNQEVPESCLLIFVGVLIGVILLLMNDVNISPLTPDTFFLYMLPPIILDAGYYMPNRLFFDNLGTILMFAVIGTVFNALTIGISLWVLNGVNLYGHDIPLLEIFLFSTLISAVDPVAVLAVFEEIHVNEVLYIVVFGESLLNDAVTVVLYNMFEAYNEMGFSNVLYTDLLSGVLSFVIVALGGTFIGVVWGFLTGFVTRFTHQVRVIEPILIFVMAYTAYLNAEMFHMSGILAITFCGITMKNYVEGNISHKSHTTIKYTMKMLSSSSETIIFMLLGVSTVNEDHHWNTVFVVCTIIFCTFYRTLGVMMITTLVNRFRLLKLNRVDEFVMSYGGLRGAVAFALALLINPEQVKHRSMFVTTTIAVIYFTVFFQGITIRPLVKILNVKTGEKRKPTMNERIHERFMDHLMAGVEDILGHHGNHHLRDKFRRFDNKFIRPYLLRNHQGAEPKILETYSKLAMKDALDFMRRNASTIGNISNTESVSAIYRNYTAGNLNTSSSCSQLDMSTWNIDLQELEYNPCKKDMTDARIHHLLAEELCQPARRHRRLSYSRHAVDERDLSAQVNYRTQMSTRRLVGDQHKRHHRRSKRCNKDGKPNHVSFQQNGSARRLSNAGEDVYPDDGVELKNQDEDKNDGDDWEEQGITFTVNPSPNDDYYNPATTSNSPFRFLDNPPTTSTTFEHDNSNNDVAADDVDYDHNDVHDDDDDDEDDDGDDDHVNERDQVIVTSPTMAEISLPWRRHGRDSTDSFTPPAVDSRFRWKRDGAEEVRVVGGIVKQNEFPAWSLNRDYMPHNSPSTTYLGNLDHPNVRSVIGFFDHKEEMKNMKLHPGTNNKAPLDKEANASFLRTLLIPCINISNSDESSDVNVKNKATSFINSYYGGSIGFKREEGYVPFRRCSMMDLNASVYTIPEEHHNTDSNEDKRARSSSVCIPLNDGPLYKRKSSSSSSSSSDDAANFG